MRPRSLRARLVLATALVSLATMTLLVVGLQIMLGRSTTNDSIVLLRARVDAAASTVRIENGKPKVLETTADSLDQNVWVFDANGTLIDGVESANIEGNSVAGLRSVRSETTVVVKDRHRVLARPVVIGGHTVAVVVASLDLSPYEHAERRALVFSVVLGVLSVIAASGAASAATEFSLGKVRQMARTADDWREHDLQRRFAPSGPADELTELGATLDRMLDRIEQTIRAERRLTDEVAHELRTPLTSIRSEAELALMYPEPNAARSEALHNIVASADRMAASITTMLDVARAGAGNVDRCTASDVLQAAGRHAPARSGVELTTTASDLTIAAPETVVLAALAPLVDNAVRHARSAVRLSARREGGRVVFQIDDDGSGVDGHPDVIFEAGWTTEGGAGLGLALARRLAHAMGGEVRVETPGHGRFLMELPAQ
jgi:two-component system OmpR family sensor kinase